MRYQTLTADDKTKIRDDAIATVTQLVADAERDHYREELLYNAHPTDDGAERVRAITDYVTELHSRLATLKTQ